MYIYENNCIYEKRRIYEKRPINRPISMNIDLEKCTYGYVYL